MKDYLVEDKDAAIDPEETQRRLGQVYVLLIDLARQKRANARGGPGSTVLSPG